MLGDFKFLASIDNCRQPSSRQLIDKPALSEEVYLQQASTQQALVNAQAMSARK